MARKKGGGDGGGDGGAEETKEAPPPAGGDAPGMFGKSTWGANRRKKVPDHLRFHA